MFETEFWASYTNQLMIKAGYAPDYINKLIFSQLNVIAIAVIIKQLE